MIISISIPEGALLTASTGDTVNFGDPLFKKSQEQTETVQIASLLGVAGNKIFSHLKKVIGDGVKKGEILANKQSTFSQKTVISDWEGTITSIDHILGTIGIEVNQTTTTNQISQQTAFFKGKIVEIDKKKEKMTVEVSSGVETDLKEATASIGAEAFYFDSEGLYFTATQDEIEGKIIVAENLKTHIIAKCEALGVVGFLYMKESEYGKIPGGQVKNLDDFKKLTTNKKKYILINSLDKKAVAYN